MVFLKSQKFIFCLLLGFLARQHQLKITMNRFILVAFPHHQVPSVKLIYDHVVKSREMFFVSSDG